MTIYGNLGSTYGAHTARTYGSLFDSSEVPQTGGFVTLYARLGRADVLADVASTSVRAAIITLPVEFTIN
jgi:hypothetical protein